MNNRIHLTKEYERDVSLIIEGLWARGLASSTEQRLKKKSPFRVFTVFFTTSENMQIWEHKDALNWFKDALLEENKKNTHFIETIIAEYSPLLEELKEYWKNGPITDTESLISYTKLVTEASELFSYWYYPVADERTPENVRALVANLRTTDGFFGYNDVFIKSCIKAVGIREDFAILLYPEELATVPPVDILEKRAKGVVTIDGKENFDMSLKEFATTHPEYFFEGLNDEVAKVTEVKGQIAQKRQSPGKSPYC